MLKEILYDYFSESDKERTVTAFDPEATLYFNPSSFSACRRQVYLKKRYATPSNLITAVSYMKMDMGTTIHTRIQEIVKKQGILLEAEKLKTVKFQGLDFRYKIDGKIVLNRKRHIMEIKTTSGGGMRVVKYDPKPADVVQLSLYMLFENIQNGVLLYVGRDNGHIIEYNINHECSAYTSAIAEIYHRILELKQLKSQIQKGVLPNRDFQIALKNKDGVISEKFQKEKVVYKSDYQCSYCAYKDMCWKTKLEEIKNYKFYIGGEFVD
jgi:CRISPR/Cas system-associated exonuclease Cas4 (RecB family)